MVECSSRNLVLWLEISLAWTAGSTEHPWSWGSFIVTGGLWWGVVGLVLLNVPWGKCGKTQLLSAWSVLGTNTKKLKKAFISKRGFLSFSHKKDLPRSGQRAVWHKDPLFSRIHDTLPVSDPLGCGTSSLISSWPCWLLAAVGEGCIMWDVPEAETFFSSFVEHDCAAPSSNLGAHRTLLEKVGQCLQLFPIFALLSFCLFVVPCLEWRWKRLFCFGRWTSVTKVCGSR